MKTRRNLKLAFPEPSLYFTSQLPVCNIRELMLKLAVARMCSLEIKSHTIDRVSNA